MSPTYRDEARYAVRESLEHVQRVTILGRELEVLSGTLTFTEERSPHVTATVTVRAPEDQAVLDSWDPRTFTRMQVALGYRYPSGALDRPQVADLSLTDRRVSRPDNTVTLTAESDEVLVGEAGRTGTDWTIGQTYNPVSALASLVQAALPQAVIRDEARRGSVTEAQPVVLTVGTDPMRLVLDIADRAGLWVHDDGLRTWRIREVPAIGEAAATFTVGAGGTILASETGLSREGWGNAVLVRHRWTADDRTERVVNGYSRVIDGPLAPQTIGRSLLVVERDTAIDQGRANNAATSILGRVLSRGRSFTLDAIATYWLRPGDTVTVQLPVGEQERHLVSGVRFDLVGGRMTIATRQPTTAQIGA